MPAMTSSIPAESLRIGDTIVKRLGHSTMEWPVDYVSVAAGKDEVCVGVTTGSTLGYRRAERVTIIDRGAIQ